MKLIPRFSVMMRIYDILYLSYLVPASRLRPHVPDILQLAHVGDGEVFLSIVSFHSADVRLVGLPSLSFAYDQINVRTYVIDPVTRGNGVFFLKSGITSRLTTFFTNLLGLPWVNVPFHLKAKRDQENHYIQYVATGNLKGDIQIEARQEVSCIEGISPFENPEKAVQYLTGPTIGFYGMPDKILRFQVKHSAIQPCSGRALNVSFPFLISSGLLTDSEAQAPHNLLLAPYGEFQVYLPPQSISNQL
ncbi:MAG: DUF2071 domain-containing protein [Proteobacteria bacterium]|nr:DUF2071 domain-containing protein [Pseudomonadota bacterium]